MLNAADGGPLFTLAGRYTDVFRRTGDTGRSPCASSSPMWVSGNPAVLAHVL